MKRQALYVRAATVLALVAVLAACSNPAQNHTSPTSTVPASALEGLLLSAGDIDAVMGTTGMVAHPPFTILAQHSNLLPNKNCLGIWQVGDAAIYDENNLTGFRGQDLRLPDTDTWDAMVVQAVVSLPGRRRSQGVLLRVSRQVVEVHQPPRQHDRERPAAAKTVLRQPYEDRHRAEHAGDSR